MSAWAFASQPPATAPAPPPPGPGDPAADAPVAATPPPNDDFIEFLGADDVGDAAWWEFLKSSAPHKDAPSVPPQDAKP